VQTLSRIFSEEELMCGDGPCHDCHVIIDSILATLSCSSAGSLYYIIHVISDFILATLFCFESQFIILRYTRHFRYPLYKYTQVYTNVHSTSCIRRHIRHRLRQNPHTEASGCTPDAHNDMCLALELSATALVISPWGTCPPRAKMSI
jgi:hypothetical protein